MHTEAKLQADHDRFQTLQDDLQVQDMDEMEEEAKKEYAWIVIVFKLI